MGDLDDNQIGNQGCHYLSKAQWNNLKAVSLGSIFCNIDNNDIEAKGCEYLTQSRWSKLASIFISTIVPIECKIRLVPKAIICSNNLSGWSTAIVSINNDINNSNKYQIKFHK